MRDAAVGPRSDARPEHPLDDNLTVQIHRHAAVANALGEGALWDPRAARLVWVDITGRTILWMDAGDERPRHLRLADMPGCIALARKGGYLVAAGRALYHLGDDLQGLTEACRIGTLRDGTRLNDGKADRLGGFVFGACHLDETEPLGGVFHLGAAGVSPVADGFTVFNGPAFSPAGDRIYYADSPTRRIMTATYQAESGRIVHPAEVFATVPVDAGCPDGMTVDADGYLWNAHWDGARLTRYRPDGTVDRQVAVPVARPTSLCFGGPAFATLFVTSAATTRPARRDRPDAIVDGDVLRLDPGVHGLAEATVGTAPDGAAWA